MVNFIDLITACFILLGSGTGTVVVRHLLETKRVRDSVVFRQGMESMTRVYDCLNEVVDKTGAKRAMILHSENGGGIPKGSSDLFVTISHEIHRDSRSVRLEFQKTPVDYEYIKMLSALANSKDNFLHLRTDLLPPSQLKDLYTQDNIHQTLIFVLQKKKNKFIYCSFNFREVEIVKPWIFRKCSFEAAKIKQILDQDEKRIKNWWKK